MNRLLNILFWSIISAAFIGPGTITTAASAGARYQFALLWALLFSTAACLILQEASARITIVSEKNLGQAIRYQFHRRVERLLVISLVSGAIILGCAAYEAGNILGGVAGALLAIPLSRSQMTLLVGLLAGLLLWFGKTRRVAQFLGGLVGLMGIAFLSTAFSLKPSLAELTRGALWPGFPAGSGLLVLGLIGTTVVPYNLFLGSGIARGSKLPEMRFGLSIAIILGGIISMGVLVVGSAVQGEFSFEALSATLAGALGGWAQFFFALGLFAAGFSSAITAPLAAAITARSLFERPDGLSWDEKGREFRGVWLGVLAVGVLFGLADIKPIPAIILAQALNGVLLPFVAVFLLIAVNDRSLMGDDAINGAVANTLMSIVVSITVVLGLSGILRAGAAALGQSNPSPAALIWTSAGVIALLALPVSKQIAHRRRFGTG
ncbi:MAG: divalent metal cation transporter [candidate division KSB1 bacterium]|nr:divalent metal cation transporter [candidate division KSB1 bacterium]